MISSFFLALSTIARSGMVLLDSRVLLCGTYGGTIIMELSDHHMITSCFRHAVQERGDRCLHGFPHLDSCRHGIVVPIRGIHVHLTTDTSVSFDSGSLPEGTGTVSKRHPRFPIATASRRSPSATVITPIQTLPILNTFMLQVGQTPCTATLQPGVSAQYTIDRAPYPVTRFRGTVPSVWILRLDPGMLLPAPHQPDHQQYDANNQ